MPPICQDVGALDSVLVVAGAAGSGKTTLGRALARRLGRPILDLDSVTNPLLDAVDSLITGPHWNSDGPHADTIRHGRYAVLRSAAADLVAVGLSPVLVAPFTRELGGRAEWSELVSALVPAAVMVIHLDGERELLAARRTARGASRDVHRAPEKASAPVAVPHLRVDAALATEEQVRIVVREL